MPIYNGKYYNLVGGGSWASVRNNARFYGGDLVTIDDENENNFLLNNIDWTPNKIGFDDDYGAFKYDRHLALWIGLYRDSNDNIAWSDGTPIKYLNYYPSLYTNETRLIPEGREEWNENYFALVNHTLLSKDKPNNINGTWNDIGHYGKDYYQMWAGIAETPLTYYSISDVKIEEGNTAEIVIKRSGNLLTRQALRIEPIDEDAKEGIDYNIINTDLIHSKRIAFNPGEESKSFSIKVPENEKIDWNKSFNIKLSDFMEGYGEGTIIPPQFIRKSAKITILDNDIIYTNDFHYLNSEGAYEVNEGEILNNVIRMPDSKTNGRFYNRLYWSISGKGINDLDFNKSNLTGFVDRFDVNRISENQIKISHLIKNDNATEGSEFIDLKLFGDKELNDQIGAKKTIKIIDSSKEPVYGFEISSLSINEGQTISVAIKPSGLTESIKKLYWKTTGEGITSDDFLLGATGAINVFNENTTTASIVLKEDKRTEGSETLNINFYSDASYLQQVGDTTSVLINDTSKSNIKEGTDLDEKIVGTDKGDIIKGGGGSDEIDGGLGDDTIIYTGKFKDYLFNRTSENLRISDNRNSNEDGVDTVKNVEYVQFSDQLVAFDKVDNVKSYKKNFRDYKFFKKIDGTIEIETEAGRDDITGIPKLTFADKDSGISAIKDIKGVFDQVTGKENATGEMFRLYNASFARFPDPSGLEYWIDKYSSGVDDSRAVASSFLASTEFKERYGENVSDSTYVNMLYKNVLGRDADTGGLNYWLGQLNSGEETRYEVLLGFSESAENKALFTEMTGFG